MTASPTLPFVEIFWRDLRHGMRRLKTSRALTIAAVLTLALGIGANTAIFTIVEAVLLRPLPYSHPQRLVVVWQTDAAHRDSGAYFNSYQEFLAFQQQSRSFEKLAALTWATGPRSTLWKGKPVDVLALPASVDFFSMLGATAAMGRTFAPSDLHSACTVVLAHHFWQQKLGSPADVVGQTISLDKSTSRGAAWLSSARVVRCWVKSRNERNPCPVLPSVSCGTRRRPPAISWRKVGMTSSPHGLYVQGYTRATMDGTERR